jgi:hypothetical protein
MLIINCTTTETRHSFTLNYSGGVCSSLYAVAAILQHNAALAPAVGGVARACARVPGRTVLSFSGRNSWSLQGDQGIVMFTPDINGIPIVFAGNAIVYASMPTRAHECPSSGAQPLTGQPANICPGQFDPAVVLSNATVAGAATASAGTKPHSGSYVDHTAFLPYAAQTVECALGDHKWGAKGAKVVPKNMRGNGTFKMQLAWLGFHLEDCTQEFFDGVKRTDLVAWVGALRAKHGDDVWACSKCNKTCPVFGHVCAARPTVEGACLLCNKVCTSGHVASTGHRTATLIKLSASVLSR